MRARRTDGNLSELVGAARAAGFLVYVTNDALCDLTVQFRGKHGTHSEIWECKNKDGKFTPRQEELRAAGWQIRTVRTIDDVIQARKELA